MKRKNKLTRGDIAWFVAGILMTRLIMTALRMTILRG